MNDINLTLRQSYHSLLKGNVVVDGHGVPVYYQLVPGGYPPYYILIQGISSVGNESKTNQQRRTSIQIVVSTRLALNSGYECDYIAGRIYELCYPDRSSVIAGCESIELVSDLPVADFDPAAKLQISERVITFSHIINNKN